MLTQPLEAAAAHKPPQQHLFWLAHPKRTFVQLVGTAYPTSAQYWSNFISDLRVYEVDPNTGFTAKGGISMKDVYQVSTYYNGSYYWTPQARRSVMADDFVYSISDAGLRVANIADLSKPIATAFFDKYIERY